MTVAPVPTTFGQEVPLAAQIPSPLDSVGHIEARGPTQFDLIGILSHNKKCNGVGMSIVLDRETPGEISIILSDIVPRRRAVRLPPELNSIFVLIVIGLARCPILVAERFARDPGPSSRRLCGTCWLDSPKPRSIPAVPHRGVLIG